MKEGWIEGDVGDVSPQVKGVVPPNLTHRLALLGPICS